MNLLIELFAGLGLEGIWPLTFAYAICIGSLLGFVTVYAMFAIWMERKVAAHIQMRYGPMETGAFHGWAQSLADALKLLFKEDLLPTQANAFLFWIAPAVVFCGVFAGMIVIPFAAGIQIVDLDLGIFFIIAISSVEVVGVIMAGWASNSKYSLFGAVREAAQVVSYELPAATALLAPILVVGSFRLGDFNAFQAENGWLILSSPFMPIAALCYFISSLAGCKRAPFDLPEAESELVSGFHTEYSGMRFSFFFLEEYVSMFVVSLIMATLFFGGTTLPFDLGGFGNWTEWARAETLGAVASLADATPQAIAAAEKARTEAGPFADIGNLIGAHVGLAILILKTFFFIFIQMWLRWTLPRLRVDQVMIVGYKYLLPWGLFAVIGTAIWEVLV
ncbi:MAG: NADH-quinone oxidoreductase subunit H [Pseudohongiellaceae bacterium]|jgi:NADH-quinone oxidoreductase subunit H